MALVLGTNAGFCATPPTTDPTDGNSHIDNNALAMLDTSPPRVTRITEIGIWIDSAGLESAFDFDLGLYTDDSEPLTLLQTLTIEHDDTTDVWVRAAVDWAINPSTNYWLATASAGANRFSNIRNSDGSGWSLDFGETALPASWVEGVADADGMLAIYALTAGFVPYNPWPQRAPILAQ